LHNKKYKDMIRYGGNREKVIERDNNTCQHCGSHKKLNVHHIDGSGQTNTPNNDMANLITLCKVCHAKEHTTGGKVETKCIYCKESYVADRHDVIKGKHKYCSKMCCDKDKKGKLITGFKKNCLHCGKEFNSTPHKESTGRGKYCSKECSIDATKKTVEVNCLWCDTPFQTIPSKINQGRGRFCSRQCTGKYGRSKQIEGSR